MQMLAQVPAPVSKVVYSSAPNLEHVKRVIESAPGLVILRDHPLSQQHDDVWREPIGAGKRHAQEWHEHLPGIPRERILVEGVNEFPVWEPGGMETQLAYELAFGEEGLRLGLPTIHGQLAVGWPANHGEDTPPDWTPWLPLLRWITAHSGRYLGLHEYWGFNKGVHFYAGWWFLRYRKMAIKVPTILTELGGLKAYQNPDGSWGLYARDGWKGDIEADTYFEQWRQAEAELQLDDYIVGATLFTTDGAHPWVEECDAGPVNPLWLKYAVSEAAADHAVYAPVVVIDGPQIESGEDALDDAPGDGDANFERALAVVLGQEDGWSDNPADPGGATMKGVTLGTYRAWRQAHGHPIPNKDDLRNISDGEVRQIYYEWYWLASGANAMPWPLSLAHFDLAVNGGVGRAQQALAEAGPIFLRYMAWRIDWYTRISGWQTFGAAWMRRVAALLREAV